jgi:hypothetical protein
MPLQAVAISDLPNSLDDADSLDDAAAACNAAAQVPVRHVMQVEVYAEKPVATNLTRRADAGLANLPLTSLAPRPLNPLIGPFPDDPVSDAPGVTNAAEGGMNQSEINDLQRVWASEELIERLEAADQHADLITRLFVELRWPLLAAGLLLLVTRRQFWRAVNDAAFLLTAQLQGVTVSMSSSAPYYGRRRRSSRSRSRRPRSGRTRAFDWGIGPQPSRRRTRSSSRRRTSSSRQQQAWRPAGSRPSYSRGGGTREYVVADAVFTTNGSVVTPSRSAVRGLLTCSNG